MHYVDSHNGRHVLRFEGDPSDAWPILGSIRANEPPDEDGEYARLLVIHGPDNNAWTIGEFDDAPTPTDTPASRAASAWGGPAWEYWPGLAIRCYACGDLVEPEADARGCGMHCPQCDAAL